MHQPWTLLWLGRVVEAVKTKPLVLQIKSFNKLSESFESVAKGVLEIF